MFATLHDTIHRQLPKSGLNPSISERFHAASGRPPEATGVLRDQPAHGHIMAILGVAKKCSPLIPNRLNGQIKMCRPRLARFALSTNSKDRALPFYKQFSGSELLKQVGVDDGDTRRSTGERGHLSFGPYLALEPGSYVAAFYIRRTAPATGATIELDVSGEGIGRLAHLRLADTELFSNIAGQIAMRFTLQNAADRLEARVFVESGVMVEIHQLVVFSVEFTRWAA